MPKIAYIEKTFRDDKLELIGIANGIVAEYEAQGYGLTLRQLYCQMVSRDIIPNNNRSYKNLGNLINDARLAASSIGTPSKTARATCAAARTGRSRRRSSTR